MIRSVLIADDEPNARDYLSRLIEKRSDLRLLGAMNNGQDVLNYCKTLTPDIMILDIEMPGMSGLEAARLLTRNADPSIIIFSTAYDQYAIEAFEVAAIGYLLKPFNEQQLNEVLNRGLMQLETKERAHFSERIQQVWDKLERQPNVYLREIEIKEKGLIRLVKTEEIIYLEADSEYVKIHTSGSSYLHRLALRVLEQQLPPSFRRIHRGIILNTRFITSHKYLADSRFEFTMSSQAKLISSRSYRSSINTWLLKDG